MRDLVKSIQFILIFSTIQVQSTFAQETSSEDSEIVEIEKVKEKYWAQGEESQLGVVQNRLYSKEGKLQIGLLAGRAINDPFLSVTPLGLNVSYNFTEFWGASLVGWDYRVGPSNALNVLRNEGKESNSITPENYFGAEATGSFLYGKLSLLGQSIIYYDMHFLGGLGVTKTENDTASPTLSVGLGQRFYISQSWSLRMDYRVQTYEATEVERQVTTKIGRVNGIIRQWNHVVGLEINYMFEVN